MAAIGNQIDAAFVFARSELVNVCESKGVGGFVRVDKADRFLFGFARVIASAFSSLRARTCHRLLHGLRFFRIRCMRARAAAQTY